MDSAALQSDKLLYHRPLHVAAWLVAITMFPLIWMGGLVTTHSAGMAVPDWPTSFGYNMFALPFSYWLGQYAGGAFYEHSHRLIGTVVGLMAVLLVCQAWGSARNPRTRERFGLVALFGLVPGIAGILLMQQKLSVSTSQNIGHVVSGCLLMGVLFLVLWTGRRREPRAIVRWGSVVLLGAVILQGIMGGGRVLDNNLWLARAHGVFAQLCFAATAAMCVLTSRWWVSRRVNDLPTAKLSLRLGRLAMIAIVMIVLQLCLGALMRHDAKRDPHAGELAIPDWPTSYGRVIPPMAAKDLGWVNEQRINVYKMPVLDKIGKIHLQFTHEIMAYLIFLHILSVVSFAARKVGNKPSLLLPALTLGGLAMLQVMLGVASVLLRKPADIATAHQANGSLLLATAAVLFVRCLGEYASRDRSAEPALSPVSDGSAPPVGTSALAAGN